MCKYEMVKCIYSKIHFVVRKNDANKNHSQDYQYFQLCANQTETLPKNARASRKQFNGRILHTFSYIIQLSNDLSMFGD